MISESKNIVVSIEGKALTLELDVKDEELIDAVVGALTEFVKKGSVLKVFQTYGRTLSSSSMTMVTKIIPSIRQMQEWKDDLRRVVRIQQGRI